MDTRNIVVAAFVAVLFALAITGCKNVTSSQAPNTSVTGEVWYVKEIAFPPGMIWATKIFYCPKPMGKGPANCIQAKVYEEGEAPAPSGFGAPGGFGAPAQPAYGAPAQPTYGAPPQPGFGAPAAPGGFGAPAAPQPQPAAPGYQPQQPPPPPPPSY